MKRNRSYGFGAAITAALLCAAFSAQAAVPAVINYQSRLRTTAGAAITTSTKVSFSLYSAATGGTALWTESYSQSSGACAKVVPDSNGYFSVQMGSCEAFPSTLTFTTPLYLGVTIENDAEATPRVAFAPAPYAMNSVRVGNFVSDTSANTLTGEPAGTATAGTQGFNSSGLVLQGSGWNGSAAQSKGFKVRTTATDASNYRLSVLDSTSGSESVSILNNGRVGIGITNPQSELEVAGVIYADDFRTRGGSISTTGDGTNDLIRFTRPKLIIGHTDSLTTPGPLTSLIELTSSNVSFLENASFSKLISVPSRQIKFGANTFTFPVAAPSANDLVLTTQTDGTLSWTPKSSASGSVTSVGLSVPADFTVSGSPVTDAGTLGFAWKTQSPNEILAGPASGAAVGAPAFRALVVQDIPNLDAAKITSGTFNVARGGTGIGTYVKGQIVYADAIDSLTALGIGSANQVLTVDATGIPAWKAIPSSSGGTVNSVSATIPSSLLTLSGSPITDSGTLAFDLAIQAKNEVLAGPLAGVDAKPTFRSLSAIDIPALDAAKITTGTVSLARIPTIPVTQGGTGITSNAKGDILFGDAINSLTALGIGSTGQVLTVNSAGLPVWSAPATGGTGTVTSVGLSLPPLFTVSGSPVTASGTLSATLTAQGKNKFFSGPSSGGDLAPDFRVLDPLDIPSLDAAKITTGVFATSSIPLLDASKIGSGVFGTANGGTGLATVGAEGTVLAVSGGVPAWQAIPVGLGGSGAFGQLAFWNASSTLAGNPKIIIDNTNSRMAIGTSAAPATTLVVGGDTTIGGDVVPTIGSAYDLGSATKHIRNAYIDDLYIYGAGGGSGTSTISATQTVFNGVAYNWPTGGLGNNFVLTTDTNGNLGWQNPTALVPESGWRSLAGNVRLGVISDKVGIGTASPATKLDVVGDIQASGFLSSGTGQIKFGGATYGFPTTLPSAGQVLTASSTAGRLEWQTPLAAGGGGSVTSVGFSAPSLFSVAGSPVIASGTIVMALSSQGGNTVFAGPNGATGTPLFRGLVAADIPNLDAGKITTGSLASSTIPDFDASKITSGAIGVSRGGTGLSSVGTSGQVLTVVSGAPAWTTLAAGGPVGAFINGGNTFGANTSIGANDAFDLNIKTNNQSRITVDNTGKVGIGVTTPTALLDVNGSANVRYNLLVNTSGNAGGNLTVQGNAVITGNTALSGNIIFPLGAGINKILTSDAVGNATWQAPAAPAFASQAANAVFVGPIGSAGIPDFRALAAIDIPSLDTAKLTTGTLPVTRGGTGLSSVGTNGQVLTVVSGAPAWTTPVASTSTSSQWTGLINFDNLAQSTFLGLNAGQIGGGLFNTFVGFFAGSANKSGGNNNTAIGNYAFMGNTVGVSNTAVGSNALRANVSGASNTAVGYNALALNQSNATGNTAVGAEALSQNKTGLFNTAYGDNAGYNSSIPLQNLTKSVFVGYGANASVDNLTNIIAIGETAQATKSNQVVLGNASITETLLNGTVKANGITLTSDRRLKENITELSGVLGKLDAIHGVNFVWKDGKIKGKQLGVIAQDVEKSFPELVATDDVTGMKSVNYPSLAAVAIQGVKELDKKLQGTIIPAEDNVYDLGSPTKRFKSIYLGPGTIYMMQNDGTQVSLGFSEDGANKDKFVLRGPDGKELVLSGTGAGAASALGGGCGLLCSVLTVEIKDGKARIAPIVPDVDLGTSANRLKAVFADTVNVNALTFRVANEELATAAVGKMLGVVEVDPLDKKVVKVGLVDSKDARTDALVTDMAQAKNDIALLKAQLIEVQTLLATKIKETTACRSEVIPVVVVKTVGSGDWVVAP